MAQKIITIIFFISVDIDDFLLQSESCRNQTIIFTWQKKYLNRKMYFLVSACSKEWYCFKIKKPVWVAW